MAGKCSKPHLQEMIHAYELDLLSEADLAAFELHLLECGECAREVARLGSVSHLLVHDEQVGRSIGEISETERPEAIAPEEPRWGERVRGYRLVSVVVLAAAVLIFLILKPWDIIIVSDHEALAENRLAIMYFENAQDPADTARWGEVATNILINDLSESGYLSVLSSQRLFDIMRLLEFGGMTRLDKNMASRVAEKANAKWILNGTILKVEPNIVVASQLLEAASGTVIASQKLTGKPGEDIFTLVDSLAVIVEEDLARLAAAPRGALTGLTPSGSRSREAWRYYLEGVANYNKIYYAEAIRSFEKALKYDSTLAMAYYYLAIIKDPLLIKKAKEYLARTSIKDKYYIEIFEAAHANDTKTAARLLQELLRRYPEEKMAYFGLSQIENRRGHVPQEAALLNKAIALDSLFTAAYASLIYAYISLDSFSAAFRIADRYEEIAPEEANPHDSRGDIYAVMGRNEEAVESFQAALKIKPDFNDYATLKKMNILKICAGDSEAAGSCSTTTDLSGAAQKYWLLPYIKIYEGHLPQALALFDSAIVSARDLLPVYRLNKARLYDEWGETQKALVEVQVAVKMMKELYPAERLVFRNLYIYFLARAGMMDSANYEAEQLGRWCRDNEYSDRYYWGARGSIALAGGDTAQAAAYFDRAAAPARDFTLFYLAGIAYTGSGQYTKAIDLLESITRECPLLSANGLWAIKANYYLARAYEGAGRVNEAAAKYQYIADLWKDAEAAPEFLKEARDRSKDRK